MNVWVCNNLQHTHAAVNCKVVVLKAHVIMQKT